MKHLTLAEHRAELEAQLRDCKCRVCGTTYRARGGNLCDADACRKTANLPTLAEKQAQIAVSKAVTRERERAARAERRARGRTELQEAV